MYTFMVNGIGIWPIAYIFIIIQLFMHRYFKIHKPVNMVSQFVSPDKVNLLGELDFDFPPGIHALGRLDQDSEGLLLLTTNKKITRLLFSETQAHIRKYLVQGHQQIADADLHQLQTGVSIRVKGGGYYQTPACEVCRVEDPSVFHIKPDPRAKPNQDWILIALTEGKFRQVRKMLSAINQKTRRLIRVSIESVELDTLAPGEVMEMSEPEFFRLLHLPYK